MAKFAVRFLACTALALPGMAFAQEAASDQGLGEIIVTAQKRAEGLSDVPISIAAVTGAQVEGYGANSLEEISSAIPNLKISQTGIANRIAIRGIASGDNKGFEQSVAMFVDGIYYGRDQLSRLPLVDLERVEVLRGPQPTLFGKNAIAGAVSVITRKPTSDFEASLSAIYEFEHEEAQFTGVVSGPLSDSVGGRLVAYYRDMNGYFRNTRLARSEPNAKEAFVRGILDFDNGGPFSADLKLEYADFDTKGQPREAFGPVGTYSAVFTGPLAVDTTLDWRREDNGYESRNKVFNAALNADYEIGEHVLTSVTGYVDYKTRETIDVDFTGISFLDGTNLSEDYSQFSQEIRLTSPDDDAFNYIAGAYFQHAELDVGDQVRFNPIFRAFGAPFAFIGDSTNDRSYSQKSTLWSVFAQGELSVTERLRLTAGARFNHERKTGNRVLAINAGPTNIGATTPFPGFPNAMLAVFAGLNIVPHAVSDKLSEDSLNPLVNIQFDATDDLMFYASFAAGTKAGGFDIRSNSLPTSMVARPGVFKFEDERATNYEAGLKYKSNTVAFNLSFYHTKYKDLQVNIFDGTLNFNVLNAAAATTQGVEADARISVSDNLVLSGAVAYLDFEYDNFTQGQCYFGQTPGVGGFCSYTGLRGALTPKWSGNVNADYSQPIGDSLKLGLNLNVDFSSAYIASANLDPNTRQDGYAKLGARLSIASANDNRWELALIGRNLNNKRILQTAGPLPLSTTITRGRGVAYSGIFDRPRNIALALNLRF